MRKVLLVISIFVAITVSSYGYLVWVNNAPAIMPKRTALETTLEKSIQWLEQNQDSVLTISNPTLWYMIQQAADVSGDLRLQRVFARYEQHYLKNQATNLWRPLFYPDSWVPVRFKDIASFPYYNWHFIYAITCDNELGQVAEIAAQNSPAFCDRYPLKPGCVTHQMMGIRLLQRNECGNPSELDSTVQILQQRIHRQLVLDPRVGDSYMQRVLMLVESGASDLIKPVWIQNLVDAQQADGGWSSFEPLIPVGGDRFFGFGQRLFAIKKPRSGFHISAQAILLFALLANQQP